jgi:hypothetical protein
VSSVLEGTNLDEPEGPLEHFGLTDDLYIKMNSYDTKAKAFLSKQLIDPTTQPIGRSGHWLS